MGGGCPFIRMLVPVSAGVAQHEAVVGRAVRGNGWADQVDGSSVDAVASVHAQVGACHVGGRVAGKEQDRAGDLVVRAESAHGNNLKHRVVAGHIDATIEDARPHVTRRDGVRTDPITGQRGRQMYFVKSRWTLSALNLNTFGVQLERRRRLVLCRLSGWLIS